MMFWIALKRRYAAGCAAFPLLWLWTAPAFAQDSGIRSISTPNPMAAHTWFVILAIGAFLAWSISYCLQLQKEALKRRTARDQLLLLKERLLTRIAELESEKEAGAIDEQQYRREFKTVRHQLSKVVDKLGQPARSKDAPAGR